MSHLRRTHVRIATSLFAGLGMQVGVWAVLVPELVASRSLTPGELGVALGLLAATSIASLIGAGAVADRIGRRPLVTAGAAGIALALLALAAVEARWALLPTVAFYGLANGLLDLGANTVGSDVERAHGEKLMIRLHAGFSAAAALAALFAAIGLAAGADHRAVYAAAGVVLLVLAATAARAPLPPHRETASDRPAFAGGDGVGALLWAPGVLVALALVTLCFFADGALEGYAALYLRDLLGAGALITGIGLAAFHGASFAGRLLANRAQHRLGEANLVTVAGVGAAAGMSVMVLATAAPLAAVGLLLVGLSLAPVIPTALSVAGRADPRRAGAAVSLVTTVGYTAFVGGPPLVGALADATSLRTALIPAIASTALLALAGRRLSGLGGRG